LENLKNLLIFLTIINIVVSASWAGAEGGNPKEDSAQIVITAGEIKKMNRGMPGLPAWAGTLAQVLPLTHASLCIRAAALGRDFPLVSLIVMIGYCAVFFFGAVICVRRVSI